MVKKTPEGLRGTGQGSLQKVLVVGIGNEYRSDDGIGLVIARTIRKRRLASMCIKEESGEGTALMEAWQGYDNVILVDAVSSGSPPGTLFKMNAREQKMPAKFFHSSTHAFGIAEAVELARIVNNLPPGLWIYGIEGANFTAGMSISHEVKKSAARVVEEIVHRVQGENR